MTDLHNPTTGAPMSNAERAAWLGRAVHQAEQNVIEALAEMRAYRSATGWAILKLEVRRWRKLELEAGLAWNAFCAEQPMPAYHSQPRAAWREYRVEQDKASVLARVFLDAAE